MTETERPNTVAGLMAKRDELLKLRKHLDAENRKVTCDIDHLDACIALFDPANTPEAIQRYATKHRARHGHVRRFVLTFLRDAKGPVTSRDITEAWVKDRGLRADDATFVLIRKRIGACLNGLKLDGKVIGTVTGGDYKAWTLA
ncbi:hypothetical protein [uncultured Parvibaculum sp.]|uniref:hypothetical protein n=1 Tax=uncultured Parvibaculum sp. TaxID=291828 RepID=UPI0030DA0771|tara:strand:+ start:88376 stop:88807 length:432 start_codon:yes stop_codon:yes gene_type:complete